MHFNGPSQVADIVTRLASDVWNNRRFMNNGDPFKMTYRVSVSNHSYDDDNVNKNFFFHVVYSANRFWYTVSDEWSLDKDTLTFDADDNDYNVRGTSYRRYMFSDCFTDAVRRKCVEARDSINGADDTFYLWGTFPIEPFSGKVTQSPMEKYLLTPKKQ